MDKYLVCAQFDNPGPNWAYPTLHVLTDETTQYDIHERKHMVYGRTPSPHYITLNNVLPEDPSGFRKGYYSMGTCLIYYFDNTYCTYNTDCGNACGVLFLDLKTHWTPLIIKF